MMRLRPFPLRRQDPRQGSSGIDKCLGRISTILLVLLLTSWGTTTPFSPSTAIFVASAQPLADEENPALNRWTACSPASDVADPAGVRGLFVAGPNGVTAPGVEAAVLRYLPSDPTICGANLAIPWSAIDNGPGANPQYDWSFLDQAVLPWEAAGKIVNLIVRGTNESASKTSSPATPAYVLSAADTVSCPNDDPIPLYWEPEYQEPWRAFESAVVDHVAGDPNVGYIRFGLGTGGEEFPVDGFAQGACHQAWVAQGLTAEKWLELSTSQIDYEASLGSDHPILVGINPFPGADWLPDRVAAEAAANGMGFGMQGMTVTQMQDAQAHRPCYADWCSLFATWAGKVPLEVQFRTPTTPGGGGPTGAMPALLDFAVSQARAQVVELYPEEWLVADDPAWPTYAEYHNEYAHALVQAAARIGGDANTFSPPPTASPTLTVPTPRVPPERCPTPRSCI